MVFSSISSRVRNDLFDPHLGFDLGRPRWVLAIWQLVKTCFFLTPLPWPSELKSVILRAFGARWAAKSIGSPVSTFISRGNWSWAIQLGLARKSILSTLCR